MEESDSEDYFYKNLTTSPVKPENNINVDHNIEKLQAELIDANLQVGLL